MGYLIFGSPESMNSQHIICTFVTRPSRHQAYIEQLNIISVWGRDAFHRLMIICLSEDLNKQSSFF